MDFEILVVLLFFAIGAISNMVQSAKKVPETTVQEQRPIELPNGDLLLPTGEVVPRGTVLAPPAPSPSASASPARGRPGDLVPVGVIVAPPPAARAPYTDSAEASTSEWAVSDTETLEELPEFESISMEPVETPSWEALKERPEPVRAVLETTSVDWTAEHERFHRKYVDAPKAAPAVAPARGTLASVRGVRALRQAILAAEVLGPPRSLRGD